MRRALLFFLIIFLAFSTLFLCYYQYAMEHAYFGEPEFGIVFDSDVYWEADSPLAIISDEGQELHYLVTSCSYSLVVKGNIQRNTIAVSGVFTLTITLGDLVENLTLTRWNHEYQEGEITKRNVTDLYKALTAAFGIPLTLIENNTIVSLVVTIVVSGLAYTTKGEPKVFAVSRSSYTSGYYLQNATVTEPEDVYHSYSEGYRKGYFRGLDDGRSDRINGLSPKYTEEDIPEPVEYSYEEGEYIGYIAGYVTGYQSLDNSIDEIQLPITIDNVLQHTHLNIPLSVIEFKGAQSDVLFFMLLFLPAAAIIVLMFILFQEKNKRRN